MSNRLSGLSEVGMNFGCPPGSTYSKRQYFVDVCKLAKFLKLLFRVLVQQSVQNFIVGNDAEIDGIVALQIFLGIFYHFVIASKEFRKDVCVNKRGFIN